MDARSWAPGFTLVAGPERMPVEEALARASGWATLVVGMDPSAHRDPALLGDTVATGDADLIQSWLDKPHARRLVIIDGVDALPGALPGETPEGRLGRLLDALRVPEGAGVVLIEPLPLDRLAAPAPRIARLLARVDRTRLWTGAELLPLGALGRHPELPRDAVASEGWLYAIIAVACGVGAAVAFRPSFLGTFRGVALLGDVREHLPRSLWLNNWTLERLTQGGSWNDTTDIYWPLGAEVAAIFGNLATAVLAAPFQALLGFPGYWNVFLGAALVANGLAMGWLARVAGADRAGAILGALAFALAPPLLREIERGDPHVLWAAPVPLAIGLGLRALDGGRREALLTGLAVALASLVWWFHGLFAAAVILALGVGRALRAPAERSRLLGQLGLAFRAWLPCLVAAIPLLAAANRGHLPDLDELYLPGEAGPSFAASLTFARMTRDVLPLDRLLAVPTASAGWVASALVLGLVVLWLVLHGGRRLFWLGGALVSAVLALGPWLSPSWGMSSGWLPLPLRALQVVLPPMVSLDRPDRLLIVTALCLGVLLALAWAPLSVRLPARARPAVLGALVAAIGAEAVLSGVLPLRVYDYAPPAWVGTITEEGAVIHVPLGWSESSILWQPLHGNAVAGGPDEVTALRDPTPYRTAFEDTPALAFFRELASGRMEAAERTWLREHGAAYVVVHSGFVRELIKAGEGPELDALNPLMDRIAEDFGPAVYFSEDVRVYRVR